MQHTKLTATDRKLLSQWKKEGLSNNDCAKRLGRHISTIGRELTRNKMRVSVGRNDWQIIYEPLHAHSIAMQRRQNAFDAKQPLKSKKIYGYVLKHLRKGWSPEQISGRLRKVDHKGDPSWHICHETIYQFIYKDKTDKTRSGQLSEMDGRKKTKTLLTVTDVSQPLYEYLRRKQKKRRKKGGRKSQRVRIPDRVSIHNRPTVVAERKEFGHWEGDSIVGLHHISGLHTEYERISSFTRLEKMARITAEQAAKAAQNIFGVLPAHARRSTTLDNGSEHTNHKAFGLLTYFADPYSSWQRGGNENSNLWTRYYFPKKTDFDTITTTEIQDVEQELNNRPRKRLNFRTPQEVFSEYLSNP